MAGIPLNTFRTVTKVVQQASPLNMSTPPTPYTTQNPYAIYQAPPGTTGIILYAQIANISGTTAYTASMWHYRPSGQVFTELFRQMTIPPNDVMIALGGKLVLETSDIVFVSGSAPFSGGQSDLKMVASVLESANQ